MNRWIDRQSGIGKAGRRSEKHDAKRLGARLTPGSGMLPGAKGDMTKGQFLVESKSTINGSLGLKLDWLLKIGGEARALGKTPAMLLNFTTGDGTARESWALVPLWVFKECCNQLQEEQ